MSNVLIFNDTSGLGNCSMTANVSILTKLNNYCMPVTTAYYSCNTAFDNYTVVSNDKLIPCAQDIVANCQPQVVYSGYCHSHSILVEVAQIVEQLQGKATIFVDPILGDNGKLYPTFDQEYLQQMKQLVKMADVITPNLTEACLLAEVDYSELISHKTQPAFLGYCGKVFGDICAKTGCNRVVITGIECGNLIGNIIVEGNDIHYVTNQYYNKKLSGTGDVFSSVVCGKLLQGHSLLVATQVATAFVERAICATQKDGPFGLELGAVIDTL